MSGRNPRYIEATNITVKHHLHPNEVNNRLAGHPKPGLGKHKSLNGLGLQTRAAESNYVAATRKDSLDGNGGAYTMDWSLSYHQCGCGWKKKYQVCREHCTRGVIAEGIAGGDCTTTARAAGEFEIFS
jgi:hypothetical protein